MFKRRATGQQIFPLEPAAPSLPRPVPEGQAAPSTTAELAYLDNDGAPHEGDQPLMISASRQIRWRCPPSPSPAFSFVGYPSSVDLKAWVQPKAVIRTRELGKLHRALQAFA